MNAKYRHWGWAYALMMALVLGLSGRASAGPLELGPKTLPLKIAGVTVEIPASASLDVETQTDGVHFSATANGNLQTIQENALAIVRRLPLPRDKCAKRGFSIAVDRIDEAKITPSGSTVTVELAGRVTAWACAKLLGISAKTKVASDWVKVSVPVAIVVVDPHQIGLRLAGTATVATGNELTAELTSKFAGDVDALFSAALGKILDARSARAKIPALPGLDVAIDSAAFVQDGTKLGVRAKGHGKMAAEALATLLASVVK
jgi:hypothetical protein